MLSYQNQLLAVSRGSGKEGLADSWRVLQEGFWEDMGFVLDLEGG